MNTTSNPRETFQAGPTKTEDDKLRTEIIRLRELIAGLECVEMRGMIYDCRREMPDAPQHWCQVCAAKQAARIAPDGKGGG